MKHSLTVSLKDLQYIKGIRVSNGSVRIYKKDDGQFMILLKKYFWKFRVAYKVLAAKDFEEAEDYLISARFDGLINI